MKDLGGFDVKKDTRIKGEEVTMLKKKHSEHHIIF